MKYKTFISLIALIAVIALAITHIHHQDIQTSEPSPTIKPCSSNAPACIEITLEGGSKYQLNDFTFVSRDCIDFVSLPDKVSHNFCGKYTLNWIGPSNVKQMGV